MQGRDLRKLAFIAQIGAIDFVLPSWISLILGAWFFPLLVLAFCGKKWVGIYLGLSLLISLPQAAANLLVQGNLLGLQIQLLSQTVQQPAQPPPSNFLTPVAEALGAWFLSLPREIRAAALLGALGVFFLIWGLYVWWFYLGTWRSVKRIRRRVPKTLWGN